MIGLRIKQAEAALAGGRLEEAMALVQSEPVRSHRPAQVLIGKLVAAFVARGRGHLAGGRLGQALADCEHAAKLGGGQEGVEALRKAVVEAMTGERDAAVKHEDLLAEAHRQIEMGRLSAGSALLAEAGDASQRARRMRHQVDERRVTAEQAVRGIEAAMKADDLTSAIDELARAVRSGAVDERLTSLKREVTKQVIDRVRRSLGEGRLDQAMLLLSRFGATRIDSLELAELSQAVDRCRQAAGHVDAGEFREAERVLRRLRSVLPGAKWVEQSLKQVSTAAAAMEEVHGGPLGLAIGESGWAKDIDVRETSHPAKAVAGAAGPRRVPVSDPMQGAGRNREMGIDLRGSLVLRVDGVGGFLVWRKATVTVGPISSSARPDVGLMAEPTLPVATISRSDEDYFIRCEKPVEVNGKAVTQRLLGNRDRVGLSPRCRFRFVRPHAASTSALLDLDGARLPHADIRKVVLMDRTLVIGPDSSAHVRATGLSKAITLQATDRGLTCSVDVERADDGGLIRAGQALPMDVAVRIGVVSFTVGRG